VRFAKSSREMQEENLKEVMTSWLHILRYIHNLRSSQSAVT
jgi:hypothetical protein